MKTLKSIDGKSMLIGVLLTSTIFFGVAATPPSEDKKIDSTLDQLKRLKTRLSFIKTQNKEIEPIIRYLIHLDNKFMRLNSPNNNWNDDQKWKWQKISAFAQRDKELKALLIKGWQREHGLSKEVAEKKYREEYQADGWEFVSMFQDNEGDDQLVYRKRVQ